MGYIKIKSRWVIFEDLTDVEKVKFGLIKKSDKKEVKDPIWIKPKEIKDKKEKSLKSKDKI